MGNTDATKPAMESLVKLWSGREILSIVTISLTLQLLLLFTGNLRRRKINRLLRLIVWLAYVGADYVAVFAIGLISQYKDKYKSRSHSAWDTLPFLWAPFLLVHLGGQDTITAFSIEDNNLWLRHALNLTIQVITVLYVFFKSRDLVEKKLIGIAVTIFVAGTIKYFERIWALYQGSRDSLVSPNKEREGEVNWPYLTERLVCGHIMASYARQMVVYGKGMFAGRRVSQLGKSTQNLLQEYFKEKIVETEKKLEVVEMELGMMYDLLYTKAMVLQSWAGLLCRFLSQVCIVGAFVNFLITAKDANDRTDVAITYTLFIGAILVEVCSVSTVIASPWTIAFFEEGSFLFWLSSSWVCTPFKAMQRRRQQIRYSMGQYNLADWAYSTQKSTLLNIASRVVRSIGLEKKWMDIWHVKHVEDKEILGYIDKLFGSCHSQSLTPLEVGPELRSVVSMSFEHAIFCLHIYTDLHIRRHHEVDGQMLNEAARECKMLSNYMMYLMAVHPSMLPISSSVAQDLEATFAKWVRDNPETQQTKDQAATNDQTATQKTKQEAILTIFAANNLLERLSEVPSPSPFETNPLPSLDYIKQVWVRMLMYAAAKCPGEEHARQLCYGGEALTSVWALLMHRDLGAATSYKLGLLRYDDVSLRDDGVWLSQPTKNGRWEPTSMTIYAFIHRGTPDKAYVASDYQPRCQVAQTQTATAPPGGFMHDARVTRNSTPPSAASSSAARAPAVLDPSDKGKNVEMLLTKNVEGQEVVQLEGAPDTIIN